MGSGFRRTGLRAARAGATAAAAAAALALSAGAATAPATAGAALPPPDQDPFYQQPPAGALQQAPPGTVLRSRAVNVNGLGVPLPATSWQLAYRSNDSKGRPILAVATVLVPDAPYSAGARPLVSYQMAIDSLGTQCNPSYEMQSGTEKETPVVSNLLALGWAVVVPDFEGPRMAYTAGLVAARTTLDGIRAALHYSPDGLPANTPTGLWGYSGGGQATAWAAEQQPAYAPELHVAGVAEGGVPPFIEQVARQIDGGPFFGVYFAGSVGVSREFPEIGLDSLFNAKGKALEQQISTQCAETLVTGYPNHHMREYTTVPDPQDVPRVKAVIAANDLAQAKPTAPIYIYHSVLDELIPVAGPDELVRRYCAAGVSVYYQRDAAGEHIAYAFAGGPGAIAYLGERFAGGPVLHNCPPRGRPGAGGPSSSARPGSPMSVTHAAKPRLPPAGACTTARRLTFRLRRVPGGRVVGVRAFVNGRLVLRRRGRSIRAIGFARPAGRVLRVRIVTVDSRGGRVVTRRTFRGCRRTRVTGRARHRSSAQRRRRAGHRRSAPSRRSPVHRQRAP